MREGLLLPDRRGLRNLWRWITGTFMLLRSIAILASLFVLVACTSQGAPLIG